MVIMTTALAAPAASTTARTSDLEDEVDANDLAKCFVPRQDVADNNKMKALIKKHPAAAYAPILSDKDMCGHTSAFGRALVEVLKSLGAGIHGYVTVGSIYGPEYHSPCEIWESIVIGRCKHACAG